MRTASAAATGGAFLAGCNDDPRPYSLVKPDVPGTDGWTQGEERWVATTCSQCFAGCGVRVRVVEGRAVKVEGNPACPLNEGGLGPKGQSGLHVLYHPDRLTQPLRRDGERGSGKWKPVTWEEAITEIAERLRTFRDQGDSRGVAVLDGEPRGLMPQLWKRFLTAYGSPNHIAHRSATDGGMRLAMKYMQGTDDLAAYDLRRAAYLLVFGENLLESSCQTIHLIRAASRLRGAHPGRHAKLVQVSPGFSVSAAKTDEWFSIAPGTYGALALGLAHVLIRDALYDKAFIQEHSFGFEDWKQGDQPHRGFRDVVLKDYPPDRVSEITGITVEAIERVAQELASHRPSLVLADLPATAATNGLGTAMAIHALNALLGNLERPGGVFVQRDAPLAAWPPVEGDEITKTSSSAPRLDGAGTAACPLGVEVLESVPQAILSDSPYPTKALFLYRSNPVFSKPEAKKWIDAIQKVPLVVSFSPLPDESTFWADYVLPDHTYLERWELVQPVPSTGFPVVGLRQPVVAPLYDTKATGDVILELAQAIGPPVSTALPWVTYRETARERLQGLVSVKNGSIVASDVTELIQQLEEQGGWWQTDLAEEEWETAFRTKSGKFEFYSQAIAERFAELFPDTAAQNQHLESVGVTARGDELCLPHWEPPHFAGAASEYPFVFLGYRSIDYAEGGARHLALLRDLPEAGHGGGWTDPIEMHPNDAARLGIRTGDTVWVESAVGRTQMTVRLLDEIRPGTVGHHLGHGPWPPEPSDTESLGNTYGLVANVSDPLAGIQALSETRVRIQKES